MLREYMWSKRYLENSEKPFNVGTRASVQFQGDIKKVADATHRLLSKIEGTSDFKTFTGFLYANFESVVEDIVEACERAPLLVPDHFEVNAEESAHLLLVHCFLTKEQKKDNNAEEIYDRVWVAWMNWVLHYFTDFTKKYPGFSPKIFHGLHGVQEEAAGASAASGAAEKKPAKKPTRKERRAAKKAAKKAEKKAKKAARK